MLLIALILGFLFGGSSSWTTVLVRELDSPFIADFPAPPSCDHLVDPNTGHLTTHVTLWEEQEEATEQYGYIYWAEKTMTECVRNFWNSEERIEQSKSITTLTKTHLIEDRPGLSRNEIAKVSTEEEYDCSWMSTRAKITEVVYVKKVLLSRTIQGYLLLDHHWVHQGNGLYYKDKTIMKTSNNSLAGCPFNPSRAYSGIVTTTKEFTVFTVETLQAQFTVNKGDPPLCIIQGISLYLTRAGQVISQGGEKPVGLEAKVNLREREGFRSNLLSAGITSLQHDMIRRFCSQDLVNWNNLVPPDLGNKVARYITSDPFAKGVHKNTMFKIWRTRVQKRKSVELLVNVHDPKGLIEYQSATDPKDKGFLEGVTGVRTPVVPEWDALNRGPLIPVSQGSFLNVLSGEIRNLSSHQYTLEKQVIFSEFPIDSITPKGISIERLSTSRIKVKELESPVWGYLSDVLTSPFKTILHILIGCLLLFILFKLLKLCILKRRANREKASLRYM